VPYFAAQIVARLDDDTFGRWTQQAPRSCTRGLLSHPCLAKDGRLGLDDLYDLLDRSLTDRAGWARFPVLLGTGVTTYLRVKINQ